MSQPEPAIVCPVCGYNLFGLSSPRCPECGGYYDYSAAPGYIQKEHPYLIEHHFGPRYFWRTMRKSIQSREFWNSLDTSHPVHRNRLLTHSLLTMAPFVLAGLTIIVIVLLNAMVTNLQLRQQYKRKLSVSGAPRYLLILEYGKSISWVPMKPGDTAGQVDRAYPINPWTIAKKIMIYKEVRMICMLALIPWLWTAITVAILSLFSSWFVQRSPAPRHILRSVVYAFGIAFWCGIAAVPLLVPAFFVVAHYGLTPLVYLFLFLLVWLIVACLGAYRLAIAYRTYLADQRAVGKVIASQLIALLCTAIIVIYEIPWPRWQWLHDEWVIFM